ncbi:RNA 2',3'-cyclic phosphodiesterase [Ferruginivarius sediminum]|uniref:RNA 2',3'-cyclic phosphodiesterase n=1 Tax=Ferruginivarius sediminum TaxID=2661937 RepID=A0A369TDI7_9PROT|nr:RNA 2',3'-cyclic phosphodiesterase [Ferruginivarius sediminum]RDD63411.1 RNA 2',3'-cyclic phosphodiesterase [Ferruginivarius sediminum]
MMRLFVAIPLPEQLTDRLALMAGGLDNARWVDPDNMHLTLRFLGELDGREAADVDAALGEIRVPAFDMELADIGSFGNGKKVNALWVGVEAPEPLTRLQTKVEQAVQRAGVEPERRKFRPHVTIARFKGPPGPKLGNFLHEHALFRSGPIHVDRFVLYSSKLTPKGPIYREEAVYPLEVEVSSEARSASA